MDSTVATLVAKQALGDNLLPVLIDTGLMRLDEPDMVKAKLNAPPIDLKVKLVRAGGRFLEATKGESEAEAKRKKFRDTFYQILHETAQEAECEYLVQGTIAPDWIETQGGIKTQHNVLQQVGIDPLTTYGFKVIEPIADLYKDQVRILGAYLGLPKDLSGRQPFPGPGLLVRCIGQVTKAKVQLLKAATKIVEERLAPHNYDQFFAAVIESNFDSGLPSKQLRDTAASALGLPADEAQVSTFEQPVTGVKGDERCYGKLAGLKLSDDSREAYGWLPEKLSQVQASLISKFPDITRVAILVKEKRGGGPLSILIRAVSTRDFMTAAAAPVSWKVLKDIADSVLEIEGAGQVYYDITPKPPGTIEFE